MGAAGTHAVVRVEDEGLVRGPQKRDAKVASTMGATTGETTASAMSSYALRLVTGRLVSRCG